jgi:hypothetical protein
MTDIQETTRLTYLVDPERLDSGQWCHKANKTLGEGDIAASYSADRIGMNQPLRGTFPWQGSNWVCIGLQSRGSEISAEAYRLADARAFDGKPLSYSEKTLDCDAARADPNGFYHGMAVTHRGRAFVLCGPCARFEPGQAAQLSLFEVSSLQP